MTYGFEFPGVLLFAIPFLFLVLVISRREERHFLFHPLSEHLRLRCGSGRIRSHAPFLFLSAAAFLMILAASGIWQGTREVKQAQKARLIGNIIDVSGSMTGEPLKAAVRVAKHLIEKRTDDRVNITFFASESVATPFGIPVSYLAPERVERLADGLGGSTVAAHGLFREFYAIAREDELLSENELQEIFKRVRAVPQEHAVGSEDGFAKYLEVLMSQKMDRRSADRLVNFVSDCDLSFTDYDIVSVMALYKAFNIRLEAICIGNTNLENLTDRDNRAFVSGIRAAGGHIVNLRLDANGSAPQNFEETLRDNVTRIEKLKPREIAQSIILEKRSAAKECFWGALCFMAMGIALPLARRFRVVS